MTATSTNSISILRKKVVNNIPGFDDDETGNPQNDWVKLYDFTCIDFSPANTARVYELEHDPEYQGNASVYYVDFYFESVRQLIKPPYDIQDGDYIAYKQQGELHYCRIVKTMITQIFPDCCTCEFTCTVTSPREKEKLMTCGLLEAIPDEEIPGYFGEGGNNG